MAGYILRQDATSPTIVAGRHPLKRIASPIACTFDAEKIYWDGADLVIQVKVSSGKDVSFIDLAAEGERRQQRATLASLKSRQMREIGFQPAMTLCAAIEASRERLTTRQADFLMKFPLSEFPVGSRPPSTQEKVDDSDTVNRLIERRMVSVVASKRGGRIVALTQLRGLPRARRLRGQPALMDLIGSELKSEFPVGL